MYRLAVHPRAEAPGRAHSPFLLRLGHPVAGHKVLCNSTVARGAPWARHPPAGHERAPNCASTGSSRGCIAWHKCRRKVGGVRERHHGVFRGSHRRGTLHLDDFAHCPALPSGQGKWGQGCLGMELFLHQTSATPGLRLKAYRERGRSGRRPGKRARAQGDSNAENQPPALADAGIGPKRARRENEPARALRPGDDWGMYRQAVHQLACSIGRSLLPG